MQTLNETYLLWCTGVKSFTLNCLVTVFTVNPGYKPLESIRLKNLTATPPRLQRMPLGLQPYDLVIHHYQPGKSIEIADALSRLSPEEKEAIPGMNVQVYDIHPQFSNSILQRTREQTASDPELNALIHSTLVCRQLSSKSQCP